MVSLRTFKVLYKLNYSGFNFVKPGALAAGRRAWFLKIDPVWIVGMRVCICVCVCVPAPKAISN